MHILYYPLTFRVELIFHPSLSAMPTISMNTGNNRNRHEQESIMDVNESKTIINPENA